MFTVGDVVAGRYEVSASLGQRPLGWLYRAREREIGVEVALRVIGSDMLPDETTRQGFVAKMGRARAFSHPNLVRVFGVYPTAEEVVIATQWAPGQTLQERLQDKPLSPEEARPLVTQVAGALTHAHQHGVVLGDLHTATVVLLGQALKVSNVGIGPSLPRKRFLEAVRESPGYQCLPPELRSGMTLDTRADVYSLAMLVVELLSRGVDRSAVKGPEALRTVLGRALADDPLLRQSSVDALAHELDAALSGQAPKPRRPTPTLGVSTAREPETIEDATAPVPKQPGGAGNGRPAAADETTRSIDPEELELLKGDRVTRQVPMHEIFPLRVASSETQNFPLEEILVDEHEGHYEELRLETPPPPAAVDLHAHDSAKTIERPRLPPLVNEDEIDTQRVTRADLEDVAEPEPSPDPHATPLPPPLPTLTAMTPLPPPPPLAPVASPPSPPALESLADSKDVPTKVEVRLPKVEISVELPILEVGTPPPPPTDPLASAAPTPPPADEPLYGSDDDDAPTSTTKPAVPAALAPPPPKPRRNPFDPLPPEAAADVGATTLAGKRKKPRPQETMVVNPLAGKKSGGGAILLVSLAAFVAAVGVGLAVTHWVQGQRLAAERREKQRLADELNARAEAMRRARADAGVAPAVATTPIVTHADPATTLLPRDGACPLGAHLVAGSHPFCVDVYEYPGGNTIPRTKVSFAEAGRICAARGERLCSESEWERACRGKGNASYPYGQAFDVTRCTPRAPGASRRLAAPSPRANRPPAPTT